MRPQDVIKCVVEAIQDAGTLPDNTNYVGYEPNIDTEAIKLPLVEVVTLSEARLDESNTDFVGFLEDNSGNQVGRVFHALYQLTLEVNVWTAHGSKYDPNALGDNIYSALYPYDSAGPSQDLGDDIWRVRIGDGEPDEDFSTSPTLRRWSQEVDIWAYEQFSTDEEYIVSVNYPGDGDFTDTDDPGTIDSDSAAR